MLLQKLILLFTKYNNQFAFFLLLFFCWVNSVGQMSIVNPHLKEKINSLQLILKKGGDNKDLISTINLINLHKIETTWSNTKQNFDSLTNSILKDAVRTLNLAKKFNNSHEIASAYDNLGAINEAKGNLAEAIKDYFTVLNTSREIKDTSVIIAEHYNIGKLYYEIGDVSDALSNLLTSLQMSKQFGKRIDLQQLCTIYIGKTFLEANEYDSAMKYFNESIIVSERNNETLENESIGIARAYSGIANIYQEEGKFSQALHNQFMVLKIFRNSSKKVTIFRSYLNIGNTYYKQAIALNDDKKNKKIYQAIQFLTKGLELKNYSILVDDKKLLLEAFLNLADSYKQLKNYKDALHYTLLRSKLKDSLFNQISISKVTEQQIKYEMEKVAVLEKINHEKILAEKEKINNRFLTVSAFLFITGIFAILLLRQRNQKKRAIEKAASVHRMAELEMQSLRSQLNPHFMFNSLNAIQELILMEDNERSHTYLSKFSKLVRVLLENTTQPFIPLKKEIAFLQLYLSLENLRVPDLKVSIDTDTNLNPEETFIPNMILQPYIENAIWHGLSHKRNDKQLQVRMYRQNGTVNYEIEDNGIGRKKSAELKSLFQQKHQSKGMELLSKRFKLLNEEYNSDITTTINDVINNNEVAGTLVTIKIPVKLTEQLQKAEHDKGYYN